MPERNSNTPLPIAATAAAKSERVMQWLFSQESLDSAVFHLTPLLDPMVMPDEVQLFLLYNAPEHNSHPSTPEFEPEQIRALITKSFEQYASYLAKPNEFILDFLFGDYSQTTDKNEAARKLAVLAVYPFYHSFIKEWLDESSNQTLEKSSFDEFLRKLQLTIIDYSSQEKLAEYLSPLFEFYDVHTDGNSIIRIFMDDAGYRSIEIPNQCSATALAAIIKEHSARIETTSEKQIDYPIFLGELKQAGISLPMPTKFRETEPAPVVSILPIEYFIGKKLRKKTIEQLFHNNAFEYERLLMAINNAHNYNEARLNLETSLQLHRSHPSATHFEKLDRALRLKFAISTTADAIH